ncbi:MAG TPA: hypothetical protein VNF47_18660 [Streptosporangiaceae bacterium]|nr:hypothetical protein [Streptosporangiaceae bacterium]
MLTWKVWTSRTDAPVFESNEVQASRYIIERQAQSPDVVLESPDGDTYAYADGAWHCLDTDSSWHPATGSDSSMRSRP